MISYVGLRVDYFSIEVTLFITTLKLSLFVFGIEDNVYNIHMEIS